MIYVVLRCIRDTSLSAIYRYFVSQQSTPNVAILASLFLLPAHCLNLLKPIYSIRAYYNSIKFKYAA